MAVDWTEIGDCRIANADCLAVLPTLADASVDAIVTDPPAGIEFMGKDWDSPEKWKESHSAFGFRGTGVGGVVNRQENRNPNCRRCRKHIRGSKGCRCPEGPDSDEDSDYQRRAKTRKRDRFVDFLSAVMAECLRVAKPGSVALVWAIPRTSHWTATAIEDAGWMIEDRIAHLFGTGFPKHKSKLKPACEDWWLCRKPGPKWLGVEACRIDAASGRPLRIPGYCPGFADVGVSGGSRADGETTIGRWPANVTLDEEAGALLDEQAGVLTSGTGAVKKQTAKGTNGNAYGTENRPAGTPMVEYGDSGGASRFFYVAKASKRDRDEGNTHPTVKNTALMRWLCKLACPKGGTILDPFAGRGSTLVSAWMDSFKGIGIERDPGYFAIARKRLEECHGLGGLFDPERIGAARG